MLHVLNQFPRETAMANSTDNRAKGILVVLLTSRFPPRSPNSGPVFSGAVFCGTEVCFPGCGQVRGVKGAGTLWCYLYTRPWLLVPFSLLPKKYHLLIHSFIQQIFLEWPLCIVNTFRTVHRTSETPCLHGACILTGRESS